MTLIRLTEKGKAAEQTDARENFDFFTALSDGEQETLGKMLDKINKSLKEKLGYDDKEATDRMNEAHRQMHEMMNQFRERGFGGFHGFHDFPRGGRHERWN